MCAGVAPAADLVVNGDFDSDTTHWRVVGRGILGHSTDGAAAAGSLEGAGGLAGDATHVIAGQCLSPVSGGQTMMFSARVRVVSGAPASCRIALFESNRDDCRWIALGDQVRRTTFSGGWDSLTGGSHTTAASTRSVELRLHCATSDGDHGALEVRFDDVLVNTVGPPSTIFNDDFETASTSRWSATVP